MAENTNYIGVAMGLDVTDLKAGLSEANKQIQLANSEFKSASSGMEDWTKSAEGLTAKVKQLDIVLKMQKSKLAGLQAEYEKVSKSQGENSEAARRLKVQINNQQAVVNKTQQEFKNYKETLDGVEKGTVDLEKVSLRNGKVIKNLGDEAKKAGDGFTVAKGAMATFIGNGLTALASAAVEATKSIVGLADSTREAREDMARLTSAYEGAGFSINSAQDTFTDLYKVIGETDTAVEAAQQIALLADSEEQVAKWAELATGVQATFGDALKAETFYEAANETIKLGKATGAYVQMLEGTGVVSVKEFDAHLASLNTEQEKQAYMLEISEKAMGEAGKAYEETAKGIMEAREAEAKMNLALQELGAIAEPIMTSLKLIAVDLMETIMPFVQLIGEGLQGALKGSADATSLLAEGLGGIANMLVERLTNMLPTILETILQLIPAITNTLLEAMPQLLDIVVQIVTQVLDLLTQILPQILIKISELLPQLIEQLIASLPQILEAILSLVVAIVEALPTIITTLVNALPSLIQAVVDFLLSSIPMLVDGAIQLFMAIIQALPVIIQALTTNLPKVINTIVDGIVNAVPLLLDGAIQLFNAILDAIPIVLPLIIAELPTLVNKIADTLLENLPTLIEAGVDLLSGLLEGMLDPDTMNRGLKAVGKGIVNGLKSAFKINSPSKLIEDEVGIDVGKAIVPSRPTALAKVKQHLGDFAGYVSDNLGGIKSNFDVDTVGGSQVAGRGGAVVDARMTVNYNGNLSRKQLKQIENDNYTAIKMRLRSEGVI